jgi:serine/threonine protein kinase
LKLCDFGLSVSRSPDDTEQVTVCGTHPYIAPEITDYNPKWSDKADIFALGCTLYYFIMQSTPYTWQLSNVAFAKSRRSLPSELSQEIADLVYSCIEYEVVDRPDSQKLFNIAISKVGENDLPLAAMNIADPIFQPVLVEPKGTSPKPLAPNTPAEAEEANLRPARAMIPNGPTQPASIGNVRSVSSAADARTAQKLNVSKDHRTIPERPLSAPVIEQPRKSVESFYSINAVEPYAEFEERMHKRIGSFVVDYTEEEPLNSFRHPIHALKEITPPVSINEPVEFEDSYQTTNDAPTPPRSGFSFLGRGAKGSSRGDMKVIGRIKAERSYQRLLRNGEEYVREELSHDNLLFRWYTDQKNENRAVYVVVGCIVYENAYVDEESVKTGLSGGTTPVVSAISVPVSAGYGSGSSQSGLQESALRMSKPLPFPTSLRPLY